MKNSPLIQKILESQKNQTFDLRTKQALDWYLSKIKKTIDNKKISPTRIFDKNLYPPIPKVGNIVMFRYEAKHKKTLPYYDTYPLVLILKVIPGGFIGLNFHYLHPKDRAVFMDRLYEYQKLYPETSSSGPSIKINIKYETLSIKQKLIFYKPCIKRYLNRQLQVPFITLPPNEWDIALFLPTEGFVNTKKEKVWEESREIIKKI